MGDVWGKGDGTTPEDPPEEDVDEDVGEECYERWEYMTREIYCRRDEDTYKPFCCFLVDEFNLLGADGWELVMRIEKANPLSDGGPAYIFKRRLG